MFYYLLPCTVIIAEALADTISSSEFTKLKRLLFKSFAALSLLFTLIEIISPGLNVIVVLSFFISLSFSLPVFIPICDNTCVV